MWAAANPDFTAEAYADLKVRVEAAIAENCCTAEERAVIEAAIRCRQDELAAPQKPPYDYDLGLRYFNNQAELKKACDAVIVFRTPQSELNSAPNKHN